MSCWQVGCIGLVILFGGCWWLTKDAPEVKEKPTPPPRSSTPEVSATVPPAALEILNGSKTGAESIRKRFSRAEIEKLKREYLKVDRQRMKAVEKASNVGKLVQNGRKLPDYDKDLKIINDESFGVFQKKHRLSDHEMEALASGALE
jgi:hypothetical protein